MASVLELLNLATLKAAEVALEFVLDDGHEEVQADDIDQGHGED